MELITNDMRTMATSIGPGRFDVAIYRTPIGTLPDKRGALVVIGERADNDGLCVSKAYAGLATTLFNAYLSGIRPSQVIWLEHYGPQSYPDGAGPPRYAYVHLKWIRRTRSFRVAGAQENDALRFLASETWAWFRGQSQQQS